MSAALPPAEGEGEGRGRVGPLALGESERDDGREEVGVVGLLPLPAVADGRGRKPKRDAEEEVETEADGVVDAATAELEAEWGVSARTAKVGDSRLWWEVEDGEVRAAAEGVGVAADGGDGAS